MNGDKQSQRRLARERRGGLDRGQRAEYSRRICRRICAMPELRGAGLVLSYMAVGDEADLAPLHAMLLEKGLRLAFPLTLDGGKMEARIAGENNFRPGRFGLMEPDPEKTALVRPGDIDIVLAPCLAFDEGCARLGHGAGYYDRYLPQCKKALFIAAAFEAQKLPQIACTELDVKMHAVATEKEIYRAPVPSGAR